MQARVYLDWNASAPLRPEARTAMIAALDQCGNPSSVHAEGRAARAVVEKARAQIAQAVGAMAADIVFTSGATEAAALALAGRDLQASEVEHEAVRAWTDHRLTCDAQGRVQVDDPARATLQAANSETGVLQDLPEGLAVSDFTQAFGKVPLAFDWSGIDIAFLSAHKVGGPRGVGALLLRRGIELRAQILGGGQELGRRSGTENVAGIAGFGAAAEAAATELSEGLQGHTEKVRNILETTIHCHANDTIFVGKETARLPNTSCFSVPGWKGETQVMQMDLAGFAISAGSACSSGKVRSSRVLGAMGLSDEVAQSAIRVSIGAQTTEDQVLRFAEAWGQAYDRFRARAA